ncbi:MAG: glycosyltransferase [Alphaproteobacteria bacterium]|nr:glycosyltransferase [Alphaproteobacteria bacterium]
MSKAEPPRVTIAVPCFEQEVFLFECLNSLVAQTIPAWEAFVVDDGSPRRIVERIVANYGDSRIHHIRHDTNKGLAAGRNSGLRAGRAPLVLCVDADDFLDPEFLSATLSRIETRDVECAYTEFQLIGLANDVWRWEPRSLDEFATMQWLPGAGVLMRRSFWERVGGFSAELRWNEDWDFWIGAAELGFSFERVERALYFHRHHRESRTATALAGTSEWIAREAILKKRAAFFAQGDRAARFRIGGLLGSARASRTANRPWQAAWLTARVMAADPARLFSQSPPAARPQAHSSFAKPSLRRRSEQQAKRLLWHAVKRGLSVDLTELFPSDKYRSSRDWDAFAPSVHRIYGYLSHDYPTLDEIVGRIKARSVLEFGCGSGRIVPVYLLHDVANIWLQDLSGTALDFCRQRFFCQKKIHYWQANIHAIPISGTIDLVVTSRVLQHLIDEEEFRKTLHHLASLTRYFYVNEAGMESAWRDPYLKGRDYRQIFRDLGWHIAEHGRLIAEDGTPQWWMLFADQRKASA